MQLTVDIKKDQTLIINPKDKLTIIISNKPQANTVNIGIESGKIKEINLKLSTSYEKVLSIDNEDLEQVYLVNYLIETALEGGLKLENLPKNLAIPSNLRKSVAKVGDKVLTILEVFGYKLKKEKFKPAKAQHRWSKEVAEIDFFVDFKGAKAVCRWQKRNEMLVKKGAILVAETPLNKDGSVGFAAKFTLSLRDMHKEKIKDFVTSEDIVLKSVNEVGNFLYFAGTNSWLVLKDEDGKSIDEYTVVA